MKGSGPAGDSATHRKRRGARSHLWWTTQVHHGQDRTAAEHRVPRPGVLRGMFCSRVPHPLSPFMPLTTDNPGYPRLEGVMISTLVSYWVPTGRSDLQRVQVSQLPECSRLDLSDSVKAKIPGRETEHKQCIYTEKQQSSPVPCHLSSHTNGKTWTGLNLAARSWTTSSSLRLPNNEYLSACRSGCHISEACLGNTYGEIQTHSNRDHLPPNLRSPSLPQANTGSSRCRRA